MHGGELSGASRVAIAIASSTFRDPRRKQTRRDVRYLRDNGMLDAVGEVEEEDGVKHFGVRIAGTF